MDRIKVMNINLDSNEFGGVPVFLMNVFHYINHDEIQLDYLTPETTSFNRYRKEIEQAGGEIFDFHINCKSYEGRLAFGIRLKKFLNTNSYDIVHINSGLISFDCIAAIASKSCGAKVIIHSHNTGKKKSGGTFVRYFMKFIMQANADVLCACSNEAALHTFTSKKVDCKDVIIIKNGINLHKFCYNESVRNRIRRELNIEGHFVVGHIGRFDEQKNHEFLIDIFAEILKEKTTAILLLIGNGELESHIHEKVQSLKIENHVIFLGARTDVEELYQAMDILLFPSLYEGLPITLIEAQTSGLDCCISDVISSEVDITSLIHRISLQKTAKQWAQQVLSISDSTNKRVSHEEELIEAGYEIDKVANQISLLYESLYKKG